MRSNIRKLLRAGCAFAAVAALGACAANQGGLAQGGVRTRLAALAIQSGDAAGALRMADQALTAHPGEPAALVVRGEAYTKLGEMGDAEKDFLAVLRTDPGSVSALTGLGRLRLAQDPAAAAALFRKVLDRAPGDAVALNDLGIALDLQGQHAAAQGAYRRALLLRPDLTASRVNLALSMAQAGQGGAAVALLRPVASAPKAGAKLREDYAAVLTMAGDQDQARAILSADMPPEQAAAAINAFAASVPAGAPAPSVPSAQH
ncbi:MAG: tetratricopeptide repeat protein [Rhodospirillales bacterium]|nr:tetratricopeptide repeat protein [Rhodospirillales bacterium]